MPETWLNILSAVQFWKTRHYELKGRLRAHKLCLNIGTYYSFNKTLLKRNITRIKFSKRPKLLRIPLSNERNTFDLKEWCFWQVWERCGQYQPPILVSTLNLFFYIFANWIMYLIQIYLSWYFYRAK